MPLFSPAATFTNSASIQVTNDPTQSLTCTNGQFTIMCWFRISVPSTLTLSENMTILMDRWDGNESANFSYLIRYNVSNGNVEFLSHGSTGMNYLRTLIHQPSIERWYHIVVTRSGSGGYGVFNAYVDGYSIAPLGDISNLGNTAGSGLSIGGINGNSRLFYGDIVEVAIYKQVHSDIVSHMFEDQRSEQGIRGYYKLGYSTNVGDFDHNFVSSPPAGTDPAAKVGTGNIGFEQTDVAGEQSIYDSQKNKGNDSVAPLSGTFSWRQTALARPVPGIAFDLQFSYSSGTPSSPQAGTTGDPYDNRVLGPGWRQTFDTRVIIENNLGTAKLYTWDGDIETWDLVSRTNIIMPYATRHKEYRGELTYDFANQIGQWVTPERLKYRFYDPATTTNANMAGRLLEIQDFNTNSVILNWDPNGYLTNVIDTAGGSWLFTYDTNRLLLTNVSFNGWSISFAYDRFDRLTNKWQTGPPGYASVNTSWQFAYSTPSNGPLVQIIDPRGNTNIFVQYDQYGRKTNQMDALGWKTQTAYGVPGNRQITHTDPGGFAWIETYDRKGHILSQQDPLTNVTSYTYDDFGNRTSITEPLGYKTFFGYDSRANVIARTNELFEVSQWVFHTNFNKAIQQITPQPPDANGWTTWTNFYDLDNATGNLLRHRDALGTLVSYTYETNGLVLSSTDGNGNTTRFAYDTNGFLVAKADPAGNRTTYALNDVGWKLAETNALGQVTTYTLDINGNVVTTVDPLQRIFTKTYDANGNLLSASDAKAQFTFFYYDAASQKTQTVDRAGATNRYFYTSRGELERAIDPLGNTLTNFYDNANRLISASDPLGNFITNVYDNNGNQIALIDKVSQRWTKTYDVLNRVIADADPQGDTKYTSYDPAGRIKQITTPRGFPSTHYYDGRGRLIQWVDAQGYRWLYDYDHVGNITNITDALTNHYVMTYSNRNERILERNQDNFEWRYTYDELLRPRTQRDPNGTTRALDYDAGGRVRRVRFSTGRINSFAYDLNNNPRQIDRIDAASGITSTFEYDAMDRVTAYSDDLTLREVRYAYDALGRVSALTYPDGKTLTYGYDTLSRLTNQVFTGQPPMTYAYDKAGRLTRRTYPNGLVQTNAFDNAGQITNLTYAPLNPQPSTLNLALTYAYDRNGNKVGSTEKGTLDWPMPTLFDETSRFTASGRITNRVDALNPTNYFTYRFDASGNMTNASGAGQIWALTYDEDNRTTSIKWDVLPTRTKIITNRYDALGRRISRKQDRDETRYVLDLAGNMERILCDMNGAGVVTAWYVHGPDLCYKVDATNGLTCYHADAQANIIALTDGNTNTVAQYAYTPYGRSLSPTNVQSQIANPYLFVGSQGVMEELPGLYFMRARYFSAEAGVFLSTDPMKHIGPGWKPISYAYASGSPLTFIDPAGLKDIVLEAAEAVAQKSLALTTEASLGDVPGQVASFALDAIDVANPVSGLISQGIDFGIGVWEGLTGKTSGRIYKGHYYSGGQIIGNVIGDSYYDMYKTASRYAYNFMDEYRAKKQLQDLSVQQQNKMTTPPTVQTTRNDGNPSTSSSSRAEFDYFQAYSTERKTAYLNNLNAFLNTFERDENGKLKRIDGSGGGGGGKSKLSKTQESDRKFWSNYLKGYKKSK